ncbi:MAG: phosphoribosyltransferase family protein, partial [Candidatus Altarchaeaceae archaeon]
ERSFILPKQEERDEMVKIKLNPIKEEIKGKRIILIDDSIVRGTTTRRIVKSLKEAGAKEVHVRITCPPIKFPCKFGIDMHTKKEFIAANKSVEEIREFIGADSLYYLSMESLIKAIGTENLCLGCLTGKYPMKKKQQVLSSASLM